MKTEYKVREWHTGSVHNGETGPAGLEAMLNEPELAGYHLHSMIGGIDQLMLLFVRESGD